MTLAWRVLYALLSSGARRRRERAEALAYDRAVTENIAARVAGFRFSPLD